MSDARKLERRRKERKLHREAEQRMVNQAEAAAFYRQARRAHARGGAAAAVRDAKKALGIDPKHVPALDLLADIYFDAQRYADALYYLGLLRKLEPGNPGWLYNSGLARVKLGRGREALADFRQYLELTKFPANARLLAQRETVLRLCQELEAEPTARPAEARPAPQPAPAPPEPAAPTPLAPPEIAVDFSPPPPPGFGTIGTLTDYFLRRQFLDLKLAQNFEDLLCLSSLQGVDSYVYQQETVRRVLRHFKGRALLADEVGLGKTIEACLVLKEYWVRGMVGKALVLVPPSLVAQWKGELAEKFGFAPASPDGPEFRRDPEQFWKREPLVVASLAMARLEPHASALAAAPWDMVIVDEAHCLKNRASANWKLVNSLQRRFLLMLTATPVENNLIELYNLITLLKPGLLATETEFRKEFVAPGKSKSPRNPDRLHALLSEVMIRNTRAAADVRLPRRLATTVTVAPSAVEAQLYEAVSAYVAARYPAGRQAGARTGLEWLQRQAGSSPQALNRALGRLLAGANGLRETDRRELEAIQELAAQVAESGKGRRLGQMLDARTGKLVVFTEFVPTLEYLAQVCQRHAAPYSLFSGELSRAEKDAAIARFRDEVDVLISTGSGGEGRNLQFANTVVNFDLPWNPMRLEQRVGRVHRIGQSRDVFVFNFCQAGAIEEHLLRLLHDKINMFELVVGEIDGILGNLDEGQDFAELVLELWVSARRAERVGEAFDELAERLLTAKERYAETKQLDEALFHRDFEV
ncbi:MAG: SNF2-related protein [Acidobacteriota bacterium]